MKWPWQRRRTPVQKPRADTHDEAPSEDLQRAKAALSAARESLEHARARRPKVTATGIALERQMSRNHLAELIHNALGSGS